MQGARFGAGRTVGQRCMHRPFKRAPPVLKWQAASGPPARAARLTVGILRQIAALLAGGSGIKQV